MILFKNETESPNGVHTVPLKTLRRVVKASSAEPEEMPVVVVRADGMVLSASQPWPQILIGTRKLPEHRAIARQIVRDGLADVLAWLGEPVVTPTGEEIWAQLQRDSRDHAMDGWRY